MNRWTAAILLCALAAFVACAPARADDAPKYPLLSLARLHVGIRGEYEWQSLDSPTVSNATAKDFRVGLGGLYSMVPHLSAIFRATSAIGASPHFVLGLNYEVFSGTEWAKKHAVPQ